MIDWTVANLYMRLFDSGGRNLPWRALQVLPTDGSKALIRKICAVLGDLVFPRNYQRWVARYDTLTEADRQRIRQDIARLPRTPVMSLFMPVSHDDLERLQATTRSVQNQLYPHWELYISTDNSVSEERRVQLRGAVRQDGRVRWTSLEDKASWSTKANSALVLASGHFIIPIDPGDVLAEHALYHIVNEVLTHCDAQLIFSDEDKVDSDGTRFDPWFKSDWNPALMLSCNAFGRLGVYDRTLIENLGGFQLGFDGSKEYDLILRCARVVDPERIRHIPRILYHRRSDATATRECAKSNAWEARRRALTAHLPSSRPRVSIIIATTARPALLKPCLHALLGRTSYDNFEALLLVNEVALKLSEPAGLLEQLAEKPRVRVLAYSNRPFNYSWVNNWGARQASGEVLCFLNDDTEVITGDWLEHLVARVLLPDVAAAGPMLYYPNDTIQHAGVILGLGGGVAGHACHRQPRGSRGYFGRACLEQDVSCVTAACLVIRREVFNALGGFDETMPLAYNDVDLCIRLRQAGWRIIWTPTAELYHRESASFGRHDSGERAEQFLRDVALMRQRWGPVLDADPFYNRNLSLDRPYKFAFPPR